jgi:hypothetical protein
MGLKVSDNARDRPALEINPFGIFRGKFVHTCSYSTPALHHTLPKDYHIALSYSSHTHHATHSIWHKHATYIRKHNQIFCLLWHQGRESVILDSGGSLEIKIWCARGLLEGHRFGGDGGLKKLGDAVNPDLLWRCT